MSREQFVAYANEYSGQMHEKYLQSLIENDEQSLAVLNPQQREQIEREVGKADAELIAIFGNCRFEVQSPPGVGHISYDTLYEPDMRKALGATQGQLDKVTAILNDSQPSRELYDMGQEKTAGGGTLTLWSAWSAAPPTSINGQPPKIGPPAQTPQGWIKAKLPDLQPKAEAVERQLHEQIKEVFTAQQWASLREASHRMAIGRCLRDSRILENLGVTPQQQEQLGRLREGRTYIYWELSRKLGQKLLDTLSPQQREKLVEELERQEWSNL